MCPEGARQRLRIVLSLQERGEHHPPARPQHVGRHGGQLHVRALQRFLDPVDLVGPLLHQRLAVARALPQRPKRRGRDEAAPQQAMPQQVRQPFGVLDVGRAPGHRAHVLRVDQQDGPPCLLQEVVHRPPVDAR